VIVISEKSATQVSCGAARKTSGLVGLQNFTQSPTVVSAIY
jgi:hypothetical protein